jgi:hypothetical protein
MNYEVLGQCMTWIGGAMSVIIGLKVFAGGINDLEVKCWLFFITMFCIGMGLWS